MSALSAFSRALLVALLTALSSGFIGSAPALAESVVAPPAATDAAAEEKDVPPPASPPPVEAPVEVRELWTGSLYTSSFRARCGASCTCVLPTARWMFTTLPAL